MKIRIIAVGKIKEKFWGEALNEYTKRLRKYADLEIVEVADEKAPENLSPAEAELVKQKEGERILKTIQEGEQVIVLAIEGRKMSSTALAGFLEESMVQSVGRLAFVIGGSLGVSSKVCARGAFLLSFSDMTFPHQLMRVILLEQIYRAFRIIKKEPYHK